ncbi:acetate kinase [Kibdelosporangium aridum]|uniref:Acetate kinase n=1 Tax=Kibdelosporangium aridum TaxID=2030 RepID=A0A1Y5YAJ0_KIBAR|nr:acetate kinase [Kibdelosporangium aridum]
MLTVNPGSSSLKLAVIEHGVQVGQTGFDRWDGKVTDLVRHVLRQWPDIGAVAVRFVHGGDRPAAVVLDSDTLDELDGLTRLAPLHQQASVFVASKVMAQLPSVPVVACFDTSFHASMPEAARVYGLPTDLTRRHGLRRYGFHGLSCQYALRRVADMVGLDPAVLRVVCVHMGASVSVTAVRAGASVDTSMGFTSLEGAMMATRSGSVDPGLLLHLLNAGIVEPRELSDLLNHGSGLAGMTGTDGDMRTVLPARTRGDRDAELAVDVYMHRLRREIAAVAASLDRLDAVVFTGGVATHNPQLLGEIVDGLGLFGMSAVHELLAAAGDRVVSPLGVLPRVLVITAREDLELAAQAEVAVAGARSAVLP